LSQNRQLIGEVRRLAGFSQISPSHQQAWESHLDKTPYQYGFLSATEIMNGSCIRAPRFHDPEVRIRGM
jgi:hypothetical protein